MFRFLFSINDITFYDKKKWEEDGEGSHRGSYLGYAIEEEEGGEGGGDDADALGSGGEDGGGGGKDCGGRYQYHG